jgi:hypothetical protein
LRRNGRGQDDVDCRWSHEALRTQSEREEVARVRRVPQLDVKYGGLVSKFS